MRDDGLRRLKYEMVLPQLGSGLLYLCVKKLLVPLLLRPCLWSRQ